MLKKLEYTNTNDARFEAIRKNYLPLAVTLVSRVPMQIVAAMASDQRHNDIGIAYANLVFGIAESMLVRAQFKEISPPVIAGLTYWEIIQMSREDQAALLDKLKAEAATKDSIDPTPEA